MHQVTFAQPFLLASTEVTFAQYDAFSYATGRQLAADNSWGRENRPVINVDWNNAQDYASWLGSVIGRACRLPSEAEWEYAARAGTTNAYALPAPNGSDSIVGEGLANCVRCGSAWDGTRTAPVGRFSPNAWGLYDMHGNVW
ncbi:MAG: formylglycine-generating enzyme family protein, partial [Rhodospirillales bacterium]